MLVGHGGGMHFTAYSTLKIKLKGDTWTVIIRSKFHKICIHNPCAVMITDKRMDRQVLKHDLLGGGNELTKLWWR